MNKSPVIQLVSGRHWIQTQNFQTLKKLFLITMSIEESGLYSAVCI